MSETRRELAGITERPAVLQKLDERDAPGFNEAIDAIRERGHAELNIAAQELINAKKHLDDRIAMARVEIIELLQSIEQAVSFARQVTQAIEPKPKP